VPIIVISILLAFGIDRRYDTYRDRQEEKIVLRGLDADFAANAEALRKYVERLEGNHHAAVSALEYLYAHGEVPLDSLAPLLWPLYHGGTFDPRSATLDQLQALNRADVLADPELRALLADWQTQTDDALAQQADFSEWRSSNFWPLLADLGISPSIATPMGEGLPPAPADNRVIRVGDVPGLVPRLRIVAGYMNVTRIDLNEVLEATMVVQSRISALLTR